MPALRLLLSFAMLALPATAMAQGVGVTPEGRKGRIHVVQKGDTLWDITETYLGTPWIWPSIWKENRDIEDHDLIYPGDLIWITEGEMRKITPEEAEALLAGAREGDEPASAGEEDAAPEPEEPAVPPPPPDPFAVLDTDEVVAQRRLFWAGLENAPYLSAEQLRASGSILGNHREHYWVAQEQTLIVSLGEGAVNIGDEFFAYRVRQRVVHPESGDPMGYFIEIIGRVEISEVHPETSLGKVVQSSSEIEPGDRIIPYEGAEEEITLVPAEKPVEGAIVAQRSERIYSGLGDLVILDRGSEHGLLRGNELVVYARGRVVRDPVTTARLLQPEEIVGRLFVLRTQPSTALAVVLASGREIEPGDRFRTR